MDPPISKIGGMTFCNLRKNRKVELRAMKTPVRSCGLPGGDLSAKPQGGVRKGVGQ